MKTYQQICLFLLTMTSILVMPKVILQKSFRIARTFDRPLTDTHLKSTAFNLQSIDVSIIPTGTVSNKTYFESSRSSLEEALISRLSQNELKGAESLIASYEYDVESGSFDGQNSIISIISNSCIRCNRLDYVADLMKKITAPIGPTHYHSGSDKIDELLPFIRECIFRKCMSYAFDAVEVGMNKGMILSAKSLTLLLQGFGRVKSVDLIDRLLAQIATSSVEVDLIMAHTAMDSYIRCRRFDKALKIFQAIAPHSISYTSAWNRHEAEQQESSSSQSGSKSFLKPFLSSTFQSSIEANVRTYNIMIKGLRGRGTGTADSNRNIFQYVQELISDMKANGIAPDSITMNTIIDIGVANGELEAAEELLLSPIAAPSVEAYTSIIKGFAGRGDYKSAFRIIHQMKTRGISPNSYTLTSLITACINGNDFQAARSVLADKSLFASLDTTERAAVFGSYICGLCSVSNSATASPEKLRFFVRALRSLMKMEQLNYSPDTVTMNAVIQTMCRSHPYGAKVALLLLHSMVLDGKQPDDFTFSILFSALGKEGLATEAFQLFSSRRFDLDTISINALLKALAEGSEPTYAIVLFFEAINASRDKASPKEGKASASPSQSSSSMLGGFIPTQATFTIILTALQHCFTLEAFNSSPSADDIVEEEEALSLYRRVITSSDIGKLLKAIPPPKTNIGKAIQGILNYDIQETETPQQMLSVRNNLPAKIIATNAIATVLFGNDFVANSASNNKKLSNDKSLKEKTDYLVETQNPDTVLRQLYRTMRFRFGIEPDTRMVSGLKALYAAAIPAGAWSNFNGFDQETSRLIFEDLVIAGCHPKELMPIMKYCRYSYKRERELLSENDESAVRTLRASAASFRIFQKHGWNSVNSGWSAI